MRTEEKLERLRRIDAEARTRYAALPAGEQADVIAGVLGRTGPRVSSRPCTGRCAGASDVHLRFGDGTRIPLGTVRPGDAHGREARDRMLADMAAELNPESVEARRTWARLALAPVEAADRELSARLGGLDPWELIGAELVAEPARDGLILPRWCALLRVGDGIVAHRETGLDRAIRLMDGSALEPPGRYRFAAAGVGPAEVDYIFMGVGHSASPATGYKPATPARELADARRSRIAARSLEILSRYEEAHGRLWDMARAAPACWGGNYRVGGNGLYVTQEEYEAVLPTEGLRDEFFLVANGYDGPAAAALELAGHAGEPGWADEREEELLEGDPEVYFTEFFPDDFTAADLAELRSRRPDLFDAPGDRAPSPAPSTSSIREALGSRPAPPPTAPGRRRSPGR